LKQVILALGEVSRGSSQKPKFINFRNCKLTRLLRDSLGGNFETSFIATISPGSNSFKETLSTLKFAVRIKDVRNYSLFSNLGEFYL
jgi:hypothetical protein